MDSLMLVWDALINWLAHGLIGASWWEVVLFALVATHITIASVTIFLHRAQAHRALELHAIPSHFFRLWLWLTTGMVTKEWVAIHRKHHAKCETEDDPHSPQTRGIKAVLLTGSEMYRAEAKNQETLAKFGHNTPDDWLERNLYSRFSWQGVGVMLLIDLMLFGAIGAAVWALQMAWIPITAAGIINGLGHWWGYRNFETDDTATNLSPWGVWIGGEELHNNHHAFPSSAKFALRKWEFDIGWAAIRAAQALGLAKVLRVAPALDVRPNIKVPDMDTMKALLAHRFQAMTDFKRGVLAPALREEAAARGTRLRRLLPRKLRHGLADDGRWLKPEARAQMQAWVDESPRIRAVVEARARLAQVLTARSHDAAERLHQLQAWCHEAEASGIRTLQDYAARLKGYSLQATRA